jgi:hypothetical protein
MVTGRTVIRNVRRAAACLATTAIILFGWGSSRARADGPVLAGSPLPTSSAGSLSIDGGLLLAMPTALGTGLSTGFSLGVMRGRTLAWEARASWSTAAESSIPWTVTQSDLRLRVGGALQHALGRARVGLRMGLGPTVIHETRTRNQGMGAALMGTALETSTFATLPAGDLEAFLALHVFGPWFFTVSGGPSAALENGTWRMGWLSLMGVGWQP